MSFTKERTRKKKPHKIRDGLVNLCTKLFSSITISLELSIHYHGKGYLKDDYDSDKVKL